MGLQKFHFEGISADGKKLSGFLFSENKETARGKLQKDSIAVLLLEPYVERSSDKNTERFEFKGIASHGREVRGEIEAQNQYAAYKKLHLDYGFELLYLVPCDLPYEEKEALKKQPIDPELERIFQEDKTIRTARKKEVTEKKKDPIVAMLESRREEMRFLQGEIEKAIEKVQNLLDENSDCLDANMRRDIQSRVDRLSRLRQSSSVRHLESIMKRLFEDLGSEDIFIEESLRENFPDFEIKRNKFRTAAGTLRASLNKGLASVQITENDIKKLKSIIRLRPLIKIFHIFYWSFVFLFFMLLNFWGLNWVKLLMHYDTERTNFYFHSSLFWFVTFFSALVALLFSPEIIFEKPFSWKSRLFLYGFAFLVLAIFILQFPVFCPWAG